MHPGPEAERGRDQGTRDEREKTDVKRTTSHSFIAST